MITGELKNKIDSLWDIFAAGGLVNPLDVIEQIIHCSLLIKKAVVEQDERESGLRKVLNFGHTLAHAIESVNGMDKYYHGECVAIGMLPMCSQKVREELETVLLKLGLQVSLQEDAEKLINACRHDKKMSGDKITVVSVPEIGKFQMKDITFSEFSDMIRSVALK